MNLELDLKQLIRNSEERFISYKKLLEEVFKDKINFPLEDKLTIWYKEYLRESKSNEENYLKKLIKEKEYLNQQLNSPFLHESRN